MLQSGRTARERARMISHREMQGCNNQILHMLLISVKPGNETYRKKRRGRMMVDCNEGMRAKQQPTKFLVALQEQAMIAIR
jgi:hypothetical protein